MTRLVIEFHQVQKMFASSPKRLVVPATQLSVRRDFCCTTFDLLSHWSKRILGADVRHSSKKVTKPELISHNSFQEPYSAMTTSFYRIFLFAVAIWLLNMVTLSAQTFKTLYNFTASPTNSSGNYTNSDGAAPIAFVKIIQVNLNMNF